MPVITPVDLEPLRHIDIGNNSDPSVIALIGRAQDAVEGELGRKIETHSEVDTFRGHFRYLILSQWPVTAVASVVENAVTLTAVTDYQFNEQGIVYRYLYGDPQIWQRTAGEIVVTYTAGFPSTHVGYKDLAGVVLRVALRMWDAAVVYASVDAGGIRQESVGSYSVTYASDGSESDAGYLTSDDRRVIGKWR